MQLEVVFRILVVEILVRQILIQLQFQVSVLFQQRRLLSRFRRPGVGGITNRHIQFIVDEDLGLVEVEVWARRGVKSLEPY